MNTSFSQEFIDKLAAAYLGGQEPVTAAKDPGGLTNVRRPAARWNVSGAFTQDRALLSLRQLLAEIFQAEGFHQVSGAPACAWSGGRSRGTQIRPPAILETIRTYDASGLPVNLVFSNVLIEQRHLGDTIGNYSLAALSDFNRTGGNGVVIGCDRMAEYVRSEYPGLKRIAAVARLTEVAPVHRQELYRRLAGLYDRIIVHPDDNFDLAFLGGLEDKDRYEIVVNESCVRHCLRRRQHYELVSAQFHDYLNIDLEARELQLVREVGCGHDLRKLLLSPEQRTLTLSSLECQRLYDLGFRNFKIQGRGLKNEQALLYQILRWILNDNPETDAISSRIIMRMFMT